MKRNLWTLISMLLLFSIMITGCATPAEPPEVTEPPEVEEPTEVPPAEEQPTEVSEPEEGDSIILATTTSTQDSGLLDFILPDFEAETGIQVEVIAVGTGQAIALGEDGNADVLLVHARSLEDAFMDAGHGVRREDVMYNDFVIVGPPDDPADIEGMNRAPRAFEEIASAEAPFVSRGDESGTHTKEKAIWDEAGIDPSGDWYISAGQGMGAVLTMADEQLAYTLSDRATYLARTLEGTELVILVEGDPILFNPYGVIAVNPEKSEEINNELANTFIDWLISVPTQEMISEFGVEDFGAPLFTPDSETWRESMESAGESEGIPADAALKITGNVSQEIGWLEEDIKAMETMNVEATNNSGDTETYTGVSINQLLEMAGPSENATTVIFVADDGYTAEISLEELLACTDCILSFRSQGGFRSLLPGYPGTLQVRGVVEIQIQ